MITRLHPTESQWASLAGEYLFGHVNDDLGAATRNAQALGDWVHNEVAWFDGDECFAEGFHYEGRIWVPVDNGEPYQDLAHLSECFAEAAETPLRMEVSALHCEHPVWTPVTNQKFRVWHDTGHAVEQDDFSYTGELDLFQSQAGTLRRDARHALFSESVYQLAACRFLDGFPDDQYVRTPGPVALDLLESWGL